MPGAVGAADHHTGHQTIMQPAAL